MSHAEMGLLLYQAGQILANTENGKENRPEKLKPLEGLQNDAAPTIEKQTESGATMRHVKALLQEMLEAFIEKHLTATGTMEKVAKKGRWMQKIPPRCGFNPSK